MKFAQCSVGADETGSAGFAPSPCPDPDERARETESRMTDDERFSMLYSLMVRLFGTHVREPRVPAHLPAVAGYVRGVERLGVPALMLSDTSLGVRATDDPHAGATAFPAALALGATFDPELARAQGAAIGREVREFGFNVALGGGINLVREVRNGRNFEYVSEDPLVSGKLGAAVVSGTQAEGVIALLKHVSLNVSETNKFFLDAVIDPAAHRESDLLAFQIAIEEAEPGALMGAYNLVNGEYACGNRHILQDVVKEAMRFKGWVMSDWRAVNHWDFALKGLDQQSGAQLDECEWFNEPLRRAYEEGRIPKERISEMVRRMLRSYYAIGIDRPRAAEAVNWAAHHDIALEIARKGIVLLKNESDALPLARNLKRIAMIGGFAQAGVVSGSGSSQVRPRGGYAAEVPLRSHPLLGPTTMCLFGPSPLAELRARMPHTVIYFDSGAHIADALALAAKADVVIVNAIRHEGERFDCPDMGLPFGQDALIEAVARVHTNVIVVLQTGNPVEMPWRDKVRAVVQAWFPGQAGAQAIAEILTGEVNPSGRLPVTFPASIEQTPHPRLPGADVELGTPIKVHYHEGAEIGYRWFAQCGEQPMFPFGHGLGYTQFAYGNFRVSAGEAVSVSFTVTNTGTRDGDDVPQVYLTEADGDRRMRLLAFKRVALQAGASIEIDASVDPRLLARFDVASGQWRIRKGAYRIVLARSATDHVAAETVWLEGGQFGS
ncbi:MULTISPECIES: beta-glucosidase family protein [Burkholderia]|uniref:Glycoside hydrolase family 3 C-terminal domain-containing protein n=1 Tax=Burkholderia sola TaxID=2843302 RepID=A0ABV2CE92_9BURK|nr:glycoside hydrolase family 3 protein [Burkholderia sp. CpTa8-5]MBP0609483.1 glycoside hydrolase family 3 protein [Burkholderia sp. CpTa8-5]